MRKNIFFKRIIILVLSGVILTSLLSAALYMAIARRVFTSIRADELMPVARTIATQVGQSGIEGVSTGSLFSIIRDEKLNFLDADLAVIDSENTIVDFVESNRSGQGGGGPPGGNMGGFPQSDGENPPEAFPPESGENPPEGLPPESGGGPPGGFTQSDIPPVDAPVFNMPVNVSDVTRALADMAYEQVIKSGEVVTTAKTSSSNVEYLIVAVPITDDNAEFIGVVMITKRIDELSSQLDGLNITLIASAFLAFFIILIPAYIAGRNLTQPIYKMQSVAKAMSEGDYSVRADEDVSGELGVLARSMNEFAEKSAKLEQTRRDYVANISHELRTPIASIRAMSETLRDGLVGEEEKKQRYYDHILRESMRLSRLVDDLLELSRLQSAGVAMQKSDVDIMPTLQSSATMFFQIASDADVSFHFEHPEVLPMVCTNIDRIAQVLVILLDNAVKHTPAGGDVTLGVKVEGDRLVVSVSDTGEGIEADDLPHVFERFYKSDKSRSSSGTGLGLSIAYEVLGMLDEKISVNSAVGSGSVFSFTIREAERKELQL